MPAPKNFTDDESRAIRYVMSRLIREVGASQTDIARVLGISGASLSTFLSGKKGLGRERVERLAQSIGASVADILADPQQVDVLRFRDRVTPRRGAVVARLSPPLDGSPDRKARKEIVEQEPRLLLEQRVFGLVDNREDDARTYAAAQRAVHAMAPYTSRETNIETLAACILAAARELVRSSAMPPSVQHVLAVALARATAKPGSRVEVG